MEMLLKQLRELPGRLKGLPANLRAALVLGLALIIAAAVGASFWSGAGEKYQYAFTNLSAEDSTEAAASLKNAGIPFRLEAGGAALAVPGDKVYDARLLLAAAGLPRGGGIGFELFDRGDLGVSEFTQRVNLRRATEGELARTISHLADVRSARVHLTLEERGLYREDEHKASAAVVLNLQPGRALGEREIAGIRHLVASSVPGLAPEAVSIVDGHGAVLSQDEGPSGVGGRQRELERSLEQRVVSLLEPVVGSGEVITKVTATLDDSDVTTHAEVVDPDNSALRSERKLVQSQSQDSSAPAGVAGAAANVPLAPSAPVAGPTNKSGASTDDLTRNFEVSKTTTHSVARSPRLARISVAILLDGVDGKPRPDAEVARLGELAKRAVGFDPARGDMIQISSAVFTKASDAPVAAAPTGPLASVAKSWPWAVGAAGLLIGAVLAFALSRRRRPVESSTLVLRPGAKVKELEAELGKAGAAPALAAPAVPAGPPDPAAMVRDRARQLAAGDPAKAVHLLRAWIGADVPKETENG